MSTNANKKYKYNVFFAIEERGKAKLLIDNEGYICGIYSTYRQAKAAIPKIRRNIIAHYKNRDKKLN